MVRKTYWVGAIFPTYLLLYAGYVGYIRFWKCVSLSILLRRILLVDRRVNFMRIVSILCNINESFKQELIAEQCFSGLILGTSKEVLCFAVSGLYPVQEIGPSLT